MEELTPEIILLELYNSALCNNPSEYVPEEMEHYEAENLINERIQEGDHLYFKEVNGRRLEIDLSDIDVDFKRYNRINGKGLAEKTLQDFL